MTALSRGRQKPWFAIGCLGLVTLAFTNVAQAAGEEFKTAKVASVQHKLDGSLVVTAGVEGTQLFLCTNHNVPAVVPDYFDSVEGLRDMLMTAMVFRKNVTFEVKWSSTFNRCEILSATVHAR